MSAEKEGQESVLKHFLESGSTYIIQIVFIALAAQTYSRTPLPYSMLQLGFVIVAAFTWEWWRPERALHDAVKKDNIEAVRKALSRNPRPNIRSLSGESALHYACKFSSAEMISFLVGQGAEINVVERRSESPLHWAVASGSRDKVDILIAQGAEIDIKDDLGKTPLSWAVCHNFLAIAELLLHNGADPYTQNQDGISLIEIAKEKGFKEIVKLLEE
jgi:ankyrin repeat protein